MVSMPRLCWCCSWKSSTTSGSMDLGRRLQSYPSYPLDSCQPSGSLRTETKSQSSLCPCCPGLGLTYKEPGNVCACIPPPPSPHCPPFLPSGALLGQLPGQSWWPPSTSGRVAPQHRLGGRGLGQQVDMEEGSPMKKDMKLPHSLPLAQPTRVAARTLQCSGQIQRPRRMPRVLWAQQPTGL